MKKTIFSHILNEEYLLPWWIEHHISFFDEGIIVDYGSSDLSLDIIRDKAPHWKLIRSRNSEFSALEVDKEIMELESFSEGWKMVLNTTEYLVGDDRELSGELKNRGLSIPALLMVDKNLAEKPGYSSSLLHQKPWAISGAEFSDHCWYGDKPSQGPRAYLRALASNSLSRLGEHMLDPRGRKRLLHNFPTGSYGIGRHSWGHENVQPSEALKICWLALSPWTEEFVNRKAVLASLIPKSDIALGRGGHHLTPISFWERQLEGWAPYAGERQPSQLTLSSC